MESKGIIVFIKKKIFQACRKSRIISDIAAIYLFWRKRSYLREVGWFESFFSAMPVDKKGDAIPWFTYSAIAFLNNRLSKKMYVFEYGSGNSTIWWSSRVLRVVSCEHDKSWCETLRPKLPNNAEIMFYDLVPGEDYSRSATQCNQKFDIIVIDGRDRVNCAKNSFNVLKPEGVIIWDDSDRERYQEGYDYLILKNFKRLDFWGLGPVWPYRGCTSVFYRQNNCLGI